MREVAANVSVQNDLSWQVNVHGRLVPKTCTTLADFPPTIDNLGMIMNLMECTQRAVICPGNPEEQFISICAKKGVKVNGGMEIQWHLLMTIQLWMVRETVPFSASQVLFIPNDVVRVRRFVQHFGHQFRG